MRFLNLVDFNSRPSARGDSGERCDCGCSQFQFTPLREGRLSILPLPTARQAFQFTPLREGRLYRNLLMEYIDRFQFTPLREGRLKPSLLECAFRLFQFTPLREGRHDGTIAAATANVFQFTPLREGRHLQHRTPGHHCEISIHAPPRGATIYTTCIINSSYFNSRPSARGDSNHSVSSSSSAGFQFTPLREGRPEVRT